MNINSILRKLIRTKDGISNLILTCFSYLIPKFLVRKAAESKYWVIKVLAEKLFQKKFANGSNIETLLGTLKENISDDQKISIINALHNKIKDVKDLEGFSIPEVKKLLINQLNSTTPKLVELSQLVLIKINPQYSMLFNPNLQTTKLNNVNGLIQLLKSDDIPEIKYMIMDKLTAVAVIGSISDKITEAFIEVYAGPDKELSEKAKSFLHIKQVMCGNLPKKITKFYEETIIQPLISELLSYVRKDTWYSKGYHYLTDVRITMVDEHGDTRKYDTWARDMEESRNYGPFDFYRLRNTIVHIAEFQKDESIPLLRKIFSIPYNPYRSLKGHILLALAKIGSDRSIKNFWEFFDGQLLVVTGCLENTLVELMKHPQNISYLKEAVQTEKNEYIREKLFGALARMDSSYISILVEPFEKEEDPLKRSKIALDLLKLNNDIGANFLIEFLGTLDFDNDELLKKHKDFVIEVVNNLKAINSEYLFKIFNSSNISIALKKAVLFDPLFLCNIDPLLKKDFLCNIDPLLKEEFLRDPLVHYYIDHEIDESFLEWFSDFTKTDFKRKLMMQFYETGGANGKLIFSKFVNIFATKNWEYCEQLLYNLTLKLSINDKFSINDTSTELYDYVLFLTQEFMKVNSDKCIEVLVKGLYASKTSPRIAIILGLTGTEVGLTKMFKFFKAQRNIEELSSTVKTSNLMREFCERLSSQSKKLNCLLQLDKVPAVESLNLDISTRKEITKYI